MSVTALQLSRSGARGKDLDGIVDGQLRVIDDKLLRAPRIWGRNVVAYNLPTVLPLPGLDKKDAQRIVYSAILRSLDKRGFETRLLLETEATTIYIAWMTDLDTEEVEAMSALIRAKRIARNAVESFISRGSAEAPRSASAARQGRAEPAPRMVVTAADRVMNPRGGMTVEGSPETRAEPAQASAAEAALLRI